MSRLLSHFRPGVKCILKKQNTIYRCLGSVVKPCSPEKLREIYDTKKRAVEGKIMLCFCMPQRLSTRTLTHEARSDHAPDEWMEICNAICYSCPLVDELFLPGSGVVYIVCAETKPTLRRERCDEVNADTVIVTSRCFHRWRAATPLSLSIGLLSETLVT